MDFEDDHSNDKNTKIPVQDKVGKNNTATSVVQNQPETEGNPEEEKIPLPRESRNRRPPERYGLSYTFDMRKEENVKEPNSYNEAVNSLQAEDWRKAVHSQIEGLDFFDTYAPTCIPETFCILLAIAAQKDVHLGQMDVTSAAFILK